jgi:hypothetical protein
MMASFDYNSTRMLWECSFLFRFLFPHENYTTINQTINTTELTKENGTLSRWRDILKYLFYRKEKFTISQLGKL